MVKINLFVVMFCLSIFNVWGQTAQDHKVSINKGNIDSFIGDITRKGEKTIYKGSMLRTIGMPCGGIAAGQIYVRGDGTLANWWIANNAYNTGYGIDSLTNFITALGPWKVCYQSFEPFSYVDQGFKIRIRGEHRKEQIKILSKKDFDNISFIGEYPVAYIDYGTTEKEFPLKISSTVYSPFIPLNAKESAFPATILKYKISNVSDDNVSVDLTGWMQNIVCIDLKDRTFGILKNRVIANDNVRSVFMEMEPMGSRVVKSQKMNKLNVFDDFESGNYSKWKVEGTAFGKRPTVGELHDQNRIEGDYGSFLANSYVHKDNAIGKLISKSFIIKEKYITFNISGGGYPRQTCINLVIDNKVVLSATGNNNEDFLPRNWNVSKWKGNRAHLEDYR